MLGAEVGGDMFSSITYLPLSDRVSLNLELAILARLVSQQDPRISLWSLALGLPVHASIASFYMGAGDPNSGPLGVLKGCLTKLIRKACKDASVFLLDLPVILV